MGDSLAIKLRADTYERVRLAAAVIGCSQTDLVNDAIDAYLEKRREDLQAGIVRLETRLLGRASGPPRKGVRAQ